MYSRQELELVERHLCSLDPQLMVQFPHGCPLHAFNRSIKSHSSLAGDAQRMGATGIRPHVGESNLFGGTLLQEQSIRRVEEEDGKGTVEKPFFNVFHEMAYDPTRQLVSNRPNAGTPLLTNFLAGTAYWYIVLVQDDTDLIHEPDLLLVVARKVGILL